MPMHLFQGHLSISVRHTTLLRVCVTIIVYNTIIFNAILICN